MNKVKNIVYRVVFVMFAVCFTFVVFNALFRNTAHAAPRLVITMLACLTVLCAVYFVLNKYRTAVCKNYKIILIVFAVIMFTAQIILGNALECKELMFDVGAVNNGAAEWVETGTFESLYDYYYSFPNNLGAMTFLYVFFKAASLLGITHYFSVAVFVTSLMLTAAMVIVSLICKKLLSSVDAVFALALFAISPQYYVMGASVYTDTLSMLFPVLIFYLYLLSKEKTGRKKIIIYLLMGLTAAVGGLNKLTVLIMAVAVTVDICLSESKRDTIKAVVCVAAVITAVTALFNLYIYSVHLDRETAKEQNTPLLHWVMMGLKDKGYYNPGDYELTRSLNSEERNRVILNEIGKRIADKGFGGMYKLICDKSTIDFGDGTYAISDMTHFTPIKETALREWVVDDGENYDKYSLFATAVHLSVMFLMLFAAYCFAFNKYKEKRAVLFAPYLALLGEWIFLMLWETNSRYFSNFAPIIFVCAVSGMNAMMRLFLPIGSDKNVLKEKKKNNSKKNQKKA